MTRTPVDYDEMGLADNTSTRMMDQVLRSMLREVGSDFEFNNPSKK